MGVSASRHCSCFTVSREASRHGHEFFYFTDNGDLTAVRYDDWEVTVKTIKGNLFTGTEESTNVPLVTNLRQDPWGALPGPIDDVCPVVG